MTVRNNIHDFKEGYQRTVLSLKENTYLGPEQVWMDYAPMLPEWTDKDLFLSGVFKALETRINGKR